VLNWIVLACSDCGRVYLGSLKAGPYEGGGLRLRVEGIFKDLQRTGYGEENTEVNEIK